MFKEIIGGLLKSLENNSRQTSVTNRRTFCIALQLLIQTSKLKINLPAYYKKCFDAWSEVNGKTPSCYGEIINEIISNKNIFVMTKNRCTEEI